MPCCSPGIPWSHLSSGRLDPHGFVFYPRGQQVAVAELSPTTVVPTRCPLCQPGRPVASTRIQVAVAVL